MRPWECSRISGPAGSSSLWAVPWPSLCRLPPPPGCWAGTVGGPSVRRRCGGGCKRLVNGRWRPDRKSTRLNSSHSQISYAVFCLEKKNKNIPLMEIAIGAHTDPSVPYQPPAAVLQPCRSGYETTLTYYESSTTSSCHITSLTA